MDEQPQKPEAKHLQAKRRWFRFRLSTVLILTAIVAWGMACRPHIGLEYWTNPLTSRTHVVGYIPEDRDGSWRFEASSWNVSTSRGLIVHVGPNPQLAWPTLALAAFLAWKAAWAVVERRRRRSARATLLE